MPATIPAPETWIRSIGDLRLPPETDRHLQDLMDHPPLLTAILQPAPSAGARRPRRMERPISEDPPLLPRRRRMGSNSSVVGQRKPLPTSRLQTVPSRPDTRWRAPAMLPRMDQSPQMASCRAKQSSFRACGPPHLRWRHHTGKSRPRLSRLQSPQIRPLSRHRSRHESFRAALPSAPASLVRTLRLAGHPHHRPHPHRPRHHQRPRLESPPTSAGPRRRSPLRPLPAAPLAPVLRHVLRSSQSEGGSSSEG